MQRLYPDQLGRLLHDPLRNRIYDFNVIHSPEFPADVITDHWLNQFYQPDDNIHILVELDNKYNITAHCVTLIQEQLGYKIIMSPQLKDDKKSKTFVDECIEYFAKLRNEIRATCSIFIVTEHVKAYEKRYGYSAARTVMVQFSSEDT